MSTSHVEHARPVRKKSPFALGAIVLSIACLALPALAQMAASESRVARCAVCQFDCVTQCAIC